jgi:ubiquinone/menaquinone biosynthesis C-methylase UbiE
MDMWKFYDITHREHVICNPTNEDKLDRLVELLRLPAEAHVVDIACGKGEFLTRLAETYGVNCLGIDLSPFCVAEAEMKLSRRAPAAQVVFLQMNGADFEPDEPHSFAVASCIGASWVYGGYAGTLQALMRVVVPGGWVIAGEPYWLQEPPEEYLHVSELTREVFGTHAGNVEMGEQLGLDLVHTFVSNKDDWDRYEGLQWYSADEYARAHPDDPDLPELLDRVAQGKSAYLRWGRETLGWAIYVFRSRISV